MLVTAVGWQYLPVELEGAEVLLVAACGSCVALLLGCAAQTFDMGLDGRLSAGTAKAWHRASPVAAPMASVLHSWASSSGARGQTALWWSVPRQAACVAAWLRPGVPPCLGPP